MSKSFKTDAERNAYLTYVDLADSKYVNGVLTRNGVAVDKLSSARMEVMFDNLEQLAVLNEVVA